MAKKGIYSVSVAFVYYDKEAGGAREYEMNTLFRSTDKAAALGGIMWAVNRRDAMTLLLKDAPAEAERYKTVACIKVHPYQIGEPDAQGYVYSGIAGIGIGMEWKHDTSFYKTVDKLLEAAKDGQLQPGRN